MASWKQAGPPGAPTSNLKLRTLARGPLAMKGPIHDLRPNPDHGRAHSGNYRSCRRIPRVQGRRSPWSRLALAQASTPELGHLPHPLIGYLSMPKRVRARTWRPPLSRPAGGPDAAEAARRVARAGRAAIRRQHPSSLRARRGRCLPWCGELTFRTPTRHRAPNQQPGKILIPGDGAAGDQGFRIGLSARQLRWRLRDACGLSRLNDFLALWSQAHLPSCTGRSHRPRSTWPNQARLALLAVTHR
jgi:hypothetical protein